MSCTKRVIGCLICLAGTLAAAQVLESGRPAPGAPEVGVIVQHMEQAARENREAYRAYVVTREYQLFGSDDQRPSSEVLAEIRFVPPTTKNFTITGRKGSSRGENVVKRILESEQKDAASGSAPGAVSRDNYDFSYLGERRLDGHDCYLLGLKPKRKEKELINGYVWVDRSTYLVRRVQGQMAKMPSWWIKSVEVTLDFSNVSGMWLQTQTKAVAEIRVFGPHTLTASALRIRTGSTVAEAIPQPRKAGRGFRGAAVIGSFER